MQTSGLQIMSSRVIINYGKLKRYLTIIPRARMGSESKAHDAEGRMDY